MSNLSKTELLTQHEERIGEVSNTKFGNIITLVKYRSSHDITVEFNNGYTMNTTYSNFKKGIVLSPYDKTVSNTGYFGEGTCSRYINHKQTSQYAAWVSMMKRCYDEKHRYRTLTYTECTVAPEWHNFQVFAKWHDANYYKVKNEQMALDKDILFKGNKSYSPKTSIFVPKRINTLFVKSDASRGIYPLGVMYSNKAQKFLANCTKMNKKIFLGYFNTPEDAFIHYKLYKENLIKEVADEYKPFIPTNLYDAMINYKVNITD